MRKLQELMFSWLDRIPTPEPRWTPDARALRAERRRQRVERQLAELDVYVDAISPYEQDDDERSADRAV
jgi:hypothetical protein